MIGKQQFECESYRLYLIMQIAFILYHLLDWYIVSATVYLQCKWLTAPKIICNNVVRIHGAETNKVIAIFLVCKHCFCYLNVLTTEAKEPIVSRANEPVVGTLISLGDLTYCRGQTQKTMNTWNFSGMLIVYWLIAIKFRICKLTSKPLLFAV